MLYCVGCTTDRAQCANMFGRYSLYAENKCLVDRSYLKLGSTARPRLLSAIASSIIAQWKSTQLSWVVGDVSFSRQPRQFRSEWAAVVARWGQTYTTANKWHSLECVKNHALLSGTLGGHSVWKRSNDHTIFSWWYNFPITVFEPLERTISEIISMDGVSWSGPLHPPLTLWPACFGLQLVESWEQTEQQQLRVVGTE